MKPLGPPARLPGLKAEKSVPMVELEAARPGRGFKNPRDTAYCCLACAEMSGVRGRGAPQDRDIHTKASARWRSSLHLWQGVLHWGQPRRSWQDSLSGPRDPGAGIRTAHSKDLARLGWERVGG